MQYSSARLRTARSLLFVPGTRADRFAKAAQSGADAIVLDLEDAVSPGDKSRAREEVQKWLRSGNAAIVRINGVQTPWYEDDLEMISSCQAHVMLPKAETVDALADIFKRNAEAAIVPLIETASGVLAAQAICAAPGVVRVAFGSLDLAGQLGVDPSDREALMWSRTALVLASAAASLAAPVDGVTPVLDDLAITRDDCLHAKRLGFAAKMCIHPTQVAAVHRALAPSAEEVAWAHRVMSASAADDAVKAVDGEMVDRPVIERARAILRTSTAPRSDVCATGPD